MLLRYLPENEPPSLLMEETKAHGTRRMAHGAREWGSSGISFPCAIFLAPSSLAPCALRLVPYPYICGIGVCFGALVCFWTVFIWASMTPASS